MMSRGRIPAAISPYSASTLARTCALTSSCTSPAASTSAGCDAPRGSIIPIASVIVLMVLAVNIAPQVPLPGMIARSICSSSLSPIFPASRAACASPWSRIVRLLPFAAHGPKSTLPGELVPGYTTSPNALVRASGIIAAAPLLSQPEITTIACPWCA